MSTVPPEPAPGPCAPSLAPWVCNGPEPRQTNAQPRTSEIGATDEQHPTAPGPGDGEGSPRLSADRRVRPDRRLQLRRARRPRRVDRLAVPAPLRQPGRVRSDPRSRRRALDGQSHGRLPQRAPLSAGNARDRDDVHHGRGQREADRRAGVRRTPASPRARPQRSTSVAPPRRGTGRRGRAPLRAGPKAGVRARQAAVPRDRRRRPDVRWAGPDRGQLRRAGLDRGLHDVRDVHRAGRRACRVRAAMGAPRGTGA